MDLETAFYTADEFARCAIDSEAQVRLHWGEMRRRLIAPAVCLSALLSPGPIRGGDDLVIEKVRLDRPTLHVLRCRRMLIAETSP